jgi:exopolyphosphatase/guanosine-5'-triphosphate,3'-diphosphate pyrophosphatase
MGKNDFLKFAAIDIGSNAVRLLFANIIKIEGKVVFKKESLIRVPLRLGEESFTQGKISENNINKLSKTISAFKNLIDVSDVTKYKICATAALREAGNGKEVVDRVLKETGAQINIIDGSSEAKAIFANHAEQKLDITKTYLYIDVGGGSTELSLFSKNKLIKAVSFPIGTIKLLNNKVSEDVWKQVRKMAQDIGKNYPEVYGIGTGGNINKLYKLFGNNEKGEINYKQLSKARKYIADFSYDERVAILGLKPDRADVILPAAEIFLFVMEWANISTIFVPKIGLVDGIIHQMYEEIAGKVA